MGITTTTHEDQAEKPIQLTDGVVTLRPMTLEDVGTHLAGDDEEQARWLGGKSTEESVTTWIQRNQESWQNGGPNFNFGICNEESELVGMIDANTDFEGLDGVPEGGSKYFLCTVSCCPRKGLCNKSRSFDGAVSSRKRNKIQRD